MECVFKRPRSSNGIPFHFCPGCTYGVATRLIMEAIDDLDIAKKTIVIGGVGCSGRTMHLYNCDAISPMHGRALAVATGIKRALPGNIVFTMQGDGDLAAIGLAESMHAAMRAEKLTTIMINNTVYATTGGQMAPTTLVGQKTTTTPYGRDKDLMGYPLHMAEIMSDIKGCYYSERVALDSTAHILKAKRAIRKAFENQVNGKGFSFVEVLSTCPTNWGLTPVECMERIEKELIPEYPLGVYKDEGVAMPRKGA